MKDYDKNFNSAEYDRGKEKERSQKRRGRTKNIDRKRRKKSEYYSAYYVNQDKTEYDYAVEVIPAHTETRVRKYYDPYAPNYGFDEDGNRVIKSRGREITEVTKVSVPEKKIKKFKGSRNKPTPKYIKHESKSGLKKIIKNLSKRKTRHAKEDDSTLSSKKRSGHKRFWDHWLDD